MNERENYKLLKKENKAKEKKLVGEYRLQYLKLKCELYEDVQQGEELENALSDILDMLLAAMYENRSVDTVIGRDYKKYYNELIESLPQYTKEVKRRTARRKNGIMALTIAFLSIGLIAFSLWSIGILGIWSKGIAYVEGALDKYSADFIIRDDEHSIDISLADLDSNKGKVIFDDGEHKIYVSSVDNTGSLLSGGYRIHFRSVGKYSLKGGSLISGIKHYATENRWFSYEMTAKLISEYNGKKYEGPVMGLSGLIYKDGDMFSFYIFPREAYTDDGITLDEKGTVKITLTNLCENVWSIK